MEPDDTVVIQFRVSNFGWQPVVMTWEVWQEIFDFYQEPLVVEMNDDSGQTIDIDLLDSVQGAIVCKDTSGIYEWVDAIDSEEFFARVCLDPFSKSWELSIDLSSFVRETLLRRKGEISSCHAVALGTTTMLARLADRDIKLEYRCVGEECTRFLWVDEEEHDLGNNSRAELNRILDQIQPKVLPAEEINFRSTLLDEEKKVDLDIFDSINLESEHHDEANP